MTKQMGYEVQLAPQLVPAGATERAITEGKTMFGDYPYGTEILHLPTPQEDLLASTDNPNPQLFGSGRLLPANTFTFAEFDPLKAYWFRWVTGHQVVFIFWNLLAKELAEMKASVLDHVRLEHCSRLLLGGALIFEYAGSCPRDYYHQYTRPFLALAHQGFSGRWSSDYEPIPQLVKQITQTKGSAALAPHQEAFRKSYLLHQKLHYRVAKKLVPEGTSLLQDTKNQGVCLDEVQAHHYMRSDFFFLVHRTAVSYAELELSLWRRIRAIQADLQTHPMQEIPFISENHLEILQQSAAAVSELLQMRHARKQDTSYNDFSLGFESPKHPAQWEKGVNGSPNGRQDKTHFPDMTEKIA